MREWPVEVEESVETRGMMSRRCKTKERTVRSKHNATQPQHNTTQLNHLDLTDQEVGVKVKVNVKAGRRER